MNLKNLSVISTKGMTREEWLAFRQPITHIMRLFNTWTIEKRGMDFDPVQGEFSYSIMKEFFETEKWQSFQVPILGASEVGSVMGLNPYKSIIELFYEKVGVKEVPDYNNEAMFWGKELEADIAEKWQYWEGNPDSLIENFTSGKVIRKCRRMNAYLINNKFPWLFVSLDRVMNRTQDKAEGALECKTISGYSASMWENGIPPMYVCQLQTQLAVGEFEFGEIALLKDGRNFEVLPFDQHPEIIDRILQRTKKFHDIVKKGCEHWLLYLYCPDADERQNHLAAIDKLSPEPDGSTAYEDYLSKRYKDEGFEINGGNMELHLAKCYKFYAGKMKELDVKKTEMSNKLKAFLKDGAKISFGIDGNCTWKQDVKGTRVFKVNVKIEPDFQPDTAIIGGNTEVINSLSPAMPF